jgi:anti-sigma regulatory factor (Ser/Thr protein kinase)
MDKLDSVTFDELMARQEPFQGGSCTFDLSGVQLITPSALVQLAAVCYALHEDGQEPVIILDNPSVCTYLARAGFMSTVNPVARIEPSSFADYPYEYLRGSNPMLIEVTKMESGAALPDLLDHIVYVLRRRLKYPKYDAFDVVTAISEICQNTFDHNCETCGFIAMQGYGKGSKRFLEIGVADYGDGLTETLRRNPKNPKITSDLEAIKLATELGTSEHDDPTRGTGLYHLLEIIYKHEGAVQIRSGAGKVRYRMDKKQGWAFSVPYVPGVQVALTLGTKKGKS